MNIRDQLFKCKYGSMYRLGGSSSAENSNSQSSSSNTTTTNNTSSSTSDWSYSNTLNSTNSTTDTLTQDRRLVNDGGVAVSSDGGNVATTNSNNSTNNITDTYSYMVDNSYTMMMSDHGAINAARDVQSAAVGSNAKLSEMSLTAGRELANQGMNMLNANIAYARDISRQNVQQQENVMATVKGAFDSALQQVSAIAEKPLNAQNPQHILVIVGLVVFGVFAFKSMRG